jgi:hypothetical protein
MKRVIKMSKAWIAALVIGVALTGCGGGSSGSSSSQSSTDATVTQSSGGGSDSQKTVERTASLSWVAPGARQNGDKLYMSDLAGYVISYGQDPDSLDQTIRVNDPDTMEYVVEDLGQGTWYFSVQAEDSNGLISPPSDLVSKTIQS